ncbi:WXG100 family type VII secretion target [Kineococcus aurantiacus]|uniref:WXG100 family type VII secretion target n=1 Tax=Kineococcus aurantiacus TaxID=37633 RepID=A0A7Y9ASG6_9ACTN|nr:WXG100 family type VII secretion target [Kineococcus aurantiacus]NYD20926.1 WXG100 family type VII secretion target [Kineococcus aurantiacus]
MANLNVTYDDMSSAATNLEHGKSEIADKLARLKALVDSLVSGGYVTDRSSVAFKDSYDEFNTGITQVLEGLSGMSGYLRTAAQTLSDTDSQLAASLGR